MDEWMGFGTMEKRLLANAAQRREPMNGSIELLPLCNMNCDMCYVRLPKPEMEALGGMRSGEEWLSLGRQMADAGTLFLLLTGGEPLLHPDFKEIYLGFRKLGMILTINTNATLIDEEWAEFFGKHKPRRVNVTLYGAGEDAYRDLCHYPGGFARAIRGVRLLRQQGVDVRLGCSVTPKNVHDLDRLFAIAGELDVPMIADTYMHPESRERAVPFDRQSRLTPEEAAAASIKEIILRDGRQALLRYARNSCALIDGFCPGSKEPCESTCMAGKCSFSITWQGLMKPCVLAEEPAVNVFEKGFAEAWNQVHEGFSRIRYCSECSVCPRKTICKVCPVAVKQETGDYMGTPEYLCRYAAESERLLRQAGEEANE